MHCEKEVAMFLLGCVPYAILDRLRSVRNRPGIL